MGYVIAFDSNSRIALAQLDEWPDPPPDEAAFWFPDETSAGDTVVYFVGGRYQRFVGIGRVSAGWRRGSRGPWAGQWYVETTKPRQLHPHVPVADVVAATGIAPPRDAQATDGVSGRRLIRFLRGRPLDPRDSAIEGAVTESRSRRRNQMLRDKALLAADGICAACGVDFKTVLGGRGQRCLVVHHTKQLRELDQPAETRLSDLAVVCANCHLLIHANPAQAMTVSALRAQLARDSRARHRP